VVKGQIYDITKSSLWTRFDGTILKVLTNGLVVETFTVETKQQAVVVRRLNQNYGNSTRYHDETQMVDVGTEKVPGRKIIIQNYPDAENPAVGKTIAFLAMQIGTSDYNGDRFELWDLGTPPTEDQFRKIKAEADEQHRILEEQFAAAHADDQKIAAEQIAAAQKEAAAAKKASQDKKKAATDKVVKFNQDAADKGDAYGLMRMGERYRDGDGVPKDLAKAKDYLTKAAAAGSPTAADELKQLPAN
jgi:hypothetical protein